LSTTAPTASSANIDVGASARARAAAPRTKGTAALGYPVEQKLDRFAATKNSGASLRRTTPGGCPHLADGNFPHERDARAYTTMLPLFLI
jgi:hypothetical protein